MKHQAVTNGNARPLPKSTWDRSWEWLTSQARERADLAAASRGGQEGETANRGRTGLRRLEGARARAATCCKGEFRNDFLILFGPSFASTLDSVLLLLRGRGRRGEHAALTTCSFFADPAMRVVLLQKLDSCFRTMAQLHNRVFQKKNCKTG